METIFKNLDELIEFVKKGETFKIQIKVIANAKVNNIDFCGNFIKIKTTQRAVEGKANKAIIEFLSEILKVPKTKIVLVLGEKSSIKTIKIF